MSFRWVLLFTLFAGACSGPSREEHEALKKRVANIERKAKAFEQAVGRNSKLKGNKGGNNSAFPNRDAKRPAVQLGRVEVQGDVKKVVLVAGERRFPLPASVPKGDWDILATFGDAEPITVGKVTIEPKSTQIVACDGAKQTCEVLAAAGEPEEAAGTE